VGRQILIRGLADKTVRRLKRRARSQGRSLQQEVKAILDREADMLAPDEAHAVAGRWLDAMRRARGEVTGNTGLIRQSRDLR
jgi:plasmid stability protein